VVLRKDARFLAEDFSSSPKQCAYVAWGTRVCLQLVCWGVPAAPDSRRGAVGTRTAKEVGWAQAVPRGLPRAVGKPGEKMMLVGWRAVVLEAAGMQE